MSEWRNSDMWIEHKDHAPIAPAASTGAARAVVKVHNAEIDAKNRELDACREKEKALREAAMDYVTAKDVYNDKFGTHAATEDWYIENERRVRETYRALLAALTASDAGEGEGGEG